MLGKMQIRRLLFLETGSYNDQMLRPYETRVNQHDLRQMQEVTQNGARLTANALTGLAGKIMRPTAEAQGQAQIASGWGMRRFAFLLEVIDPDPFGGATVQYLTGYTNHAEISYSNQLDPNMELHFNNSISCRQTIYATPTGNVQQQRVIDTAHVMTGGYTPSWGSGGMVQTAHTMRPMDVFDTVGASTLGSFNDLIDTRPTYVNGALKKSKRANANAPTYLSNLLSTYRDTMITAEHETATLPNLMETAAAATQEPTITGDVFLNHLAAETRLVTGGMVTYRELCAIQPHLDSIAKVSRSRGPNLVEQPHERGQTEHWHGRGNETVMATILAHSVPAIMTELMFTRVSFKATNRTLNGQPEVLFQGLMSFAENLDMSQYAMALNQRLRLEILNDLSMRNIIDYDIVASFNLLGETRISISLQGGPMIEYCVPSFADALFVPIMTNDYSRLTTLAHDVTMLTDNLSVAHAPAHNLIHNPYAENNHGITGAL